MKIPPHRGPPGPGGGAGSGTGALPGQGNHLLNRRTRGAGGAPADEEGEFDFQAGLAKFDKEKVRGWVMGSSPHRETPASIFHCLTRSLAESRMEKKLCRGTGARRPP